MTAPMMAAIVTPDADRASAASTDADRTVAELVIRDLADENAELRERNCQLTEANRQYLDLIFDLSVERAVLWSWLEREHVERLWGTVTIRALRRLARQARS
jgi:hypothetical protein